MRPDPAERASVAVETVGLTKVYEPLPRSVRLLVRGAARQPVAALQDVDLSISQGQICAVVGPNGAGKSTLFRILTGLTTATSGAVRVLGLDCTHPAQARRAPVGFMPADERSLLLRLSCRENLVFQGQLRGYSGGALRARVDETLELVGLGQVRDRAVYSLSSGMKARVQIGRALVHEPRVLVLDEPTSAVDPVAAYELLTLIKRLTRDRALAVVLSSHRLEEIDALDELVVLLDGGRVVFNGALSALRRLAVVTELTIEMSDEAAAHESARRLLASPLVERLERQGRTLEVVARGRLGGLLASLGSECQRIVHVDEHSGSTRSLLQRVYAGATS